MSGSEQAPSWWHWRSWPVVVKLVAVLLVPTLVALTVGVLRIVDLAGTVPGYSRISEVVGVQQRLSDLIGALQQERTLATAFVATGRTGDRATLEQQFAVVDRRTSDVRDAADQVGDLGPTGYSSVLDQMRALRTLRQSVTAGSGPVEVVVTEYGAAIEPLIALDAALVRQLNDVSVADDAAAVHALVSSREQVSRQQAIISAAVYADRITPGQVDDVRAAAVRLGTGQEEFRAALPPGERAGYVARVVGDAELSRQRLMQLVLNRGSANVPLAISPADWDARNARAIEDILAVENELRPRIDRTAVALRNEAATAAMGNAVVLILALGLGVLVGVLIARSMLRPLSVLRRTALDVANRRLPEAVTRIMREGDVPEQSIEPVPVHTREEFGQVARAFDEVHRQAVRLAGEQARLRSHINDIFVNLSRRSKGLVERQLKLIDRLESSEQDPEQLDNLFQLDHLATRMRRNSDNLLVLAGTEAAKRTSRPVRLVDVLRAAVSEVEQYQRLVLQQPPPVLVLGRTASDLVHLLAELLDNATQFSPPDTHVMVSSEYTSEGSVVIEVIDRGVGMTEAEFVDANERLASTPMVDASVSRRMGLFVVGRLAERHGIGVRVRRGEDGVGVCATVTMPPPLVRAISDSGPGQRGPGSPMEALPAGSGQERPQASRRPSSDLVPRDQFSGTQANGNGDRHGGQPRSGGLAAPGSPLPRRTPSRSTSSVPPPVPPGPPMSPPVAIPSAESSGANLFQPATPPTGSGAERARPTAADTARSTADTRPSAADSGGARSAGEAGIETARAETPSADRTAGPAQATSPVALREDSRAPQDAPTLLPDSPDSRMSPDAKASPDSRTSPESQDSTPIFDDVASAWFREHQDVPVHWTEDTAQARAPETAPAEAAGEQVPAETAEADRPASARSTTRPAVGTTADTPAEREDLRTPQPDQATEQTDATGLTAGTTAAGLPRRRPSAARAGVSSQDAETATPPSAGVPSREAEAPRMTAAGLPARTPRRRQEGSPPSATGSAAAPGSPSAGGPNGSQEPAAPPEPQPRDDDNWGAADHGWRAAQALSEQVVETTEAGLPRRRPRAQLVPGAAGAEQEPATAAPMRTPEAIRGRLASYQRGVREGRQNTARWRSDNFARNGDDNGAGPHGAGQQQARPAEPEEETK